MKKVIFLKNVNWFLTVMKLQHVLGDVGTEFINNKNLME